MTLEPVGGAPEKDQPLAADLPTRSSSRDATLPVAALLFVLSGAAALVYQVAWQRILALTTGVAVHSVAIITAAFMVGLGLGSHLGGALSIRLTPRRAVRAFAFLELAIAAFAVLSVPLYYGLLYGRASRLYASLVPATLTHLLSLLPPTLLMGMSLPFLVRGCVRNREGAPRVIGLLYGANALGAAMGAALTPWFLLRFLGVEGAVLVGAVLSAIAAVGALVLARRAPDQHPADPVAEMADAHPAAGQEPAQPFRLWVLLYALSGFVSLSLEIVWFRVLDVAAKGAAFTFGTLLAIYLAGLAAGTFTASSRAARIRNPLEVFLACQAGIVLTTLAGHSLFVWLPPDWPLLSWFTAYGSRQYGVQMVPFELGAFLAVYVGLTSFLFGPATFLMGFGFPVLQRATQVDVVGSGRRVGLLQAANIAGCSVGSLVTGLVLFDAFGTAGIFRFLAVVSGLVILASARRLRDRRVVALAGALFVAAVLFPSSEALWRRLHGAPPPEGFLVEEDAAGVTSLTAGNRGYRMDINGRHESWLPFGWLHSIIGTLAAVAHEAPSEAAVIGLGSGDTAWAAGCREETRRVTVFEIASSQPRLVARVAGLPRMTKLAEFLADSRVTIVKDDGRRRLRVEDQRYDIIVADSVDPDTSLTTYLYSVEYYRIVKQRLKPGGIICALARTPRIRAAMKAVFPHRVSFREDIILASPDPIDLEPGVWLGRLRSARVTDYLGLPRVRAVADFIEAARVAEEPSTDEVIRDLEPWDEFFRPLATSR